MTSRTTTGKIRQMAIRPRIAIDVDAQLNYALEGIAARESMNQGKRVTKRELTLEALMKAYPELKPFVLAELGRKD